MYQDPEHPAISRHFANLGDRQVHFRVAGSGPPLLILHQSPTSSAEMATEVESFAANFTAIGVDTPGFGQSDPLLKERPSLTDYAQVLDEFLTALGIDKTLVYGFHTGAMIGFEFARLYPERCAAAVVNGLVVMEGDELEDFLEHYNFVPPPTPAGEQMAWTWARLRDQRLFFPWYRKTADARMAFDLPDAESQQPYVVDFLRAGDGGRSAYQAAFSYPTRERMSAIQSPVMLANYEQDPLAVHPERLAGWPDCVEREFFADPDSLNRRATQFLLAHAPPAIELPRTSIGETGGLFRKDIVNTEFGPVFVQSTAPSARRPLLMLHDAGASSESLLPLATDFAQPTAANRQIVLVDLPGHGETGTLRLDDYSAESIAHLLVTIIERLELAHPDVLAVGAVCSIAVELARSPVTAMNRVVLIEPWLFDDAERAQLAETYAPDLTPRQSGQHLLAAWTYARDSELFWPWNAGCAQNALTRDPEILPEQTQARAIDVLMAGSAFQSLVRASLAFDIAASLAAVAIPVLIFARRGNGHENQAEKAARICPGAIYNQLPAATSAWAQEISELLKPDD